MVILLHGACGYRMSARYGALPGHITTIAVPSFDNKTMNFALSAPLTQAVKREFIERSACRIASDEAEADAVLQGTITGYSVTPIAIKRQNVGTSFLITLRVKILFSDRRENRVIYSNPSFILREEYILSERNIDFYVEEGPAIERAAQAFADRLVTTILEDF